MKNQNPIFLGEPLQIYDSINCHYPKIFELYKQQKAQDWAEDEFSFEQSRIDFQTCPEASSQVMLKTLMWQWEADSRISRSLVVAFAPFITNSEYSAAIMKQSEIEVLHALTYSEIIRQCLGDPVQILKDVLENPQIEARSEALDKALSDLKTVGIEYQIHGDNLVNLVGDKHYIRKAILKGLFAVMALEGIEFIASFACTFALVKQDWFAGIGNAVQKIMLDEILHTKIDLEVLKETLKDEDWQEAFEIVKPEIKQILDEVVLKEEGWSEYIFSEGRSILGLNTPLLKQWVYYNAYPLYSIFDIEFNFPMQTADPLVWMKEFIEIDKQQNANQEQQNGGYLLNTVKNDVDNEPWIL